jgi:pimeloyl-ACP methyl ester carboxylesterase
MKKLGRILLVVFVVLLLLVVIGPLLVPIPPLRDAVPADLLADPDSQFVDVDGLRVHFKSEGVGHPTLILLHGFGASLFSWHRVMESLAEQGQVVAFDRPAFGLTQRPMPGDWEGESPYSLPSQVSQTIGLMDALGVKQAVLVGNSAGGTVAVATALAAPERVTGLVLVSPALSSHGPVPGWLTPLLRTPQMRRIGPLMVRSIATWGEQTIDLAWHNPDRVDERTLEGYRKPLQVQNWDRALWEFTVASRPTSLLERAHELQLPVLVITGDDDRLVPTEQSIRLAPELPNAELVVIPACGHVSHEECPEAFLAGVTSWLERYVP